MGQQGSSVCCCCGGDKRASEVLNESLQVKLLDEETNVTVDTRQSSERVRLKESSTRHAGVATTDGDADSEDARNSEQRKRIDEQDREEDQFDELYPTKGKATRDHTGSSYNTSHAWDLSQDSRVDFESSVHSQQEISSSDLSLMGARIADLSMQGLESEASTRSNREDSYASSHEEATTSEGNEEEKEEEKSPVDSLRRRSVARPSSSRVFDDEEEQRHSRERGLTELTDQGDEAQGFGSYGSNSSLLQSFVSRESDVGPTTSFAESQRVLEDTGGIAIDANEGEDGDKPSVGPPSHSPRHKHKKKKKSKHKH